jgi:hypothetical protein
MLLSACGAGSPFILDWDNFTPNFPDLECGYKDAVQQMSVGKE